MTREAGRASPVDRYLDTVHTTFDGVHDGAVADYIPALAAADPAPFGIALATTTGSVHESGDTDVEFTIQSISKPFTYALAIADRGLDRVLEHIGVEPSGEAFNEVSLDARGRPLNPMINAGAIASTSLVAGPDPFARILDWLGRWAGRTLSVDEAVYRGESETGHRNRAIVHLLRASEVVTGAPDEALDAYFRQCSVLVTARDLAVMAATLAARGRNPLTGEQVADGRTVDHVLAVMTTCGMYDGAGRWLVDVGLPAKSGVAGGIIGVLPGQLGLATFSPRLDEVGNSVRGVAAFARVSQQLQLHFLRPGHRPDDVMSRWYALADVPSTRRRGAAAREVLDQHRAEVAVCEVRGDLLFSVAESISRRAPLDRAVTVVLDLERLGVADQASGRVLRALASQFAAARRRLLLAHAPAALVAAVGARDFATVDAAKEWCENAVLTAHGWVAGLSAMTLAEHEIAAGLATTEVDELAGLTVREEFAAGEEVVRRGADATEVFVLLDGEVEVTGETSEGTPRRLTTLGAGMTFGESALSGTHTRTADVRALSDTTCLVLPVAKLLAASPAVQIAVLRNLLAASHDALDRATRLGDTLAR